MKILKHRSTATLFVLLTALGLVALAGAACGGGEEAEPTPTPPPTATAAPPTAVPTPTTAVEEDHGAGEIAFDAASATITVDGDASDWSGIEGATVTLAQFELPPGVTFDDLDWDEPGGSVDPVDVTVKVATDADNIYVLLEVPDDYDFVEGDHGKTASPNVMFLIDPEAGTHMGVGDEDFEVSLGMVDIWHWEIDCGAGVMSGGGDPGSGDDPDCNLDDEYATNPEEREDDGGGDIANPAAENNIAGVWEHTARADGIGADGTWIFEMSRPLQTGDPQDAQFASGGTVLLALAYYDADETADGWTAEGHLVSSENGWIAVTLP
jgi:hypothetical protein